MFQANDKCTVRPGAMACLVAALTLTACTVTPQMATTDEVATRVKEDVARMYKGQDPITGPVTLEVAVARTLKYNLDYRLKQMESALSLGITDYSKFEMWPRLLVTAGYNTRNNDSGGTSVGIEDGIVALRPATSMTRNYQQAGAEFSWSVLDFGLSYYRAKQYADQFLIAEERRRKLVQNMIQDVRAAYWRALAAQRLATQAKEVVARAETALSRSREAEVQRVISPALALNYQRALLDAISLLNQRRQDLDFARHELAAMMSVEPGTSFTLAEIAETPLPPLPTNVSALEEMALLQRPELREEDFKKRITAAEARKQFLNIFPNLSTSVGVNYNSNDFLYNKNWQQASVNISWNLLRLFSVPSLNQSQEQQVKVDEARRAALSMAIITQLRVGLERYRLAVEDHRLADEGAKVDQRLADFTKASVTARLENELEAIRTQARAVLAAYQRGNTYANAQIAFGRLYNSLGFDPLEDNFDGKPIGEIANLVKKQLADESAEGLKLKSNLFRPGTRVSLQIQGVEPALAQQMKSALTNLLARNDVESDASGLPLTFSLQRDSALAIDRARWTILFTDAAGKSLGMAEFATKVPENSASSVMESTLLAAATSQLSTLKSWLAGQEARSLAPN
jgi:outer membrane protein TolC